MGGGHLVPAGRSNNRPPWQDFVDISPKIGADHDRVAQSIALYVTIMLAICYDILSKYDC